MNIKQAKKIQPGALVRESWMPGSVQFGLVLDKTHVYEKHIAKILGQDKAERYDLTIFWINGRYSHNYFQGTTKKLNNPQVVQNWEVMVVSHAR